MNPCIRAHSLLRVYQILSNGQRAEDILRPHSMDLTKQRPWLGYGHWGSESGAMTDRYLHLLAQGGSPMPPARSELGLLSSAQFGSPRAVLVL